MEHTGQGLIAARALPDGSWEYRETGTDLGELVRRLREYDPMLSLVRNDTEGQWEIWRTCDDGKPRRIGRRPKTEKVPHPNVVLDQLAKFDTWKGYDPVKDVEAHNLKVDADRASEQDELVEDKADKLHFAMSRDLSSHAPAARIMPLSTPRSA